MSLSLSFIICAYLFLFLFRQHGVPFAADMLVVVELNRDHFALPTLHFVEFQCVVRDFHIGHRDEGLQLQADDGSPGHLMNSDIQIKGCKYSVEK